MPATRSTFLAGGTALLLGGGSRLSSAANLIAAASYVAVTILLYFIFKPVNGGLSLLAAFFSLAGCAHGALRLFHLAPFHINSLVFFGIYCLLIGYLIFRSTFLPRFLGAGMTSAGLGWLTFLSPELANYLSPYNLATGIIAEAIADPLAPHLRRECRALVRAGRRTEARMTRTTNARLAGFTFLFYIVTGITSMVLSGQAKGGAEGTAAKLASLVQHATTVRVNILLTLLQAACALVLAVTLYALTRDEDRDLAVMALCCRVGEGVVGVLAPLGILALLSVATASTAALGAEVAAANALGSLAMKVGGWTGTHFGTLLRRGQHASFR